MDVTSDYDVRTLFSSRFKQNNYEHIWRQSEKFECVPRYEIALRNYCYSVRFGDSTKDSKKIFVTLELCLEVCMDKKDGWASNE